MYTQALLDITFVASDDPYFLDIADRHMRKASDELEWEHEVETRVTDLSFDQWVYERRVETAEPIDVAFLPPWEELRCQARPHAKVI